MQALVLREQFRQQYLPLLHRLRGDPRQAEFLADLQSLQNQRRAFSIRTRLRAGDWASRLALLGTSCMSAGRCIVMVAPSCSSDPCR